MALGSIVITGASSGIGEACARYFDKKGFRVFAGIRQAADGERLRENSSDRLTPIPLDVTDTNTIQEAVRAVGRKEISGLINNAGVVVAAPIELLPLEQLRRQLEVNVVGNVAVTQAFLPLVRNGRGRIINIGSIAGRTSLPMTGAYAASKHALEAITEALRMELAEWGISVSIIEPGAVRTPIWEKSSRMADEMVAQARPDDYDLYRHMIAKMRKAADQMGAHAIPVDQVVAAVNHALTAARPKTRYVVGSEAKVRILMNHLPDRTRERIILKRINSIPT